MRRSILFLAFALATAAASPEARADDKVKTSEATQIFARRGEQSKVIAKVEKGTVMKRLKVQGRWVQVRVKGRTGWVPRTYLEMDEEVARNTRRRPFVDGRGTKRGFGGEEGPDDRVGADAVGDGGGGDDEDEDEDSSDEDTAKPTKPTKPAKEVATKGGGDDDDDDADSDADDEDAGDEDADGSEEDEEDTGPPRKTIRVAGKTSIYSEADDEGDVEFTATEKMALYPTGNREGKFIEVENDEGDLGYILESDIESEETVGGIEEGGEAAVRGRQIDLRARLGVTIVQQLMTTAGGPTGIPNNYKLSTSAATLSLGTAYMKPYKERLVIGGDVGYDFALNTGITVMQGAEPLKIKLHTLNLRGVVGYDLRKKSGMMVFGRLGVRYESFQVNNVADLTKNAGLVPSEIIVAPQLGAALTLPRLTSKIGLRFSLDTVIAGASYKQTRRLEDGQNPTARGALVGAGLTYAWKEAYFIQATYDLSYFSKSFGAPVADSNRQHMGMSSSRRDVYHMATVGVARAF